MNWRRFAFQSKENGLGTLYTAMTSKDPNLQEGYKILFKVDNEVQHDFLISNQMSILEFLRTKLNNYKLELIVEVEKVESNQLFTSKDKYMDMVKRNPSLSELQNKFKLDIDF